MHKEFLGLGGVGFGICSERGVGIWWWCRCDLGV